MSKPCLQIVPVAPETRALIIGLFGKGNARAAFKHRLAQCVHASECGRLCPSLVKGPGVSQIACVNVETGESVNLYEALEREDFICPRGLF